MKEIKGKFPNSPERRMVLSLSVLVATSCGLLVGSKLGRLSLESRGSEEENKELQNAIREAEELIGQERERVTKRKEVFLEIVLPSLPDVLISAGSTTDGFLPLLGLYGLTPQSSEFEEVKGIVDFCLREEGLVPVLLIETPRSKIKSLPDELDLGFIAPLLPLSVSQETRDTSRNSGIDRRDFLKWAGLAGGLSVLFGATDRIWRGINQSQKEFLAMLTLANGRLDSLLTLSEQRKELENILISALPYVPAEMSGIIVAEEEPSDPLPVAFGPPQAIPVYGLYTKLEGFNWRLMAGNQKFRYWLYQRFPAVAPKDWWSAHPLEAIKEKLRLGEEENPGSHFDLLPYDEPPDQQFNRIP